MRRACVLLLIAAGCDVDVSLGSHDGGIDAPEPSCHAPPDAGACVDCQTVSCCEEYEACTAASPCQCIVECVHAGHALDGCVTHCAGPNHGAHDALLACTSASCHASCF